MDLLFYFFQDDYESGDDNLDQGSEDEEISFKEPSPVLKSPNSSKSPEPIRVPSPKIPSPKVSSPPSPVLTQPLPTRRTTRNQPAKSPSPPPPREPSPMVPSPKIPSPRPASPDETVQPNGNLPSKPPVRSYTRSTRNTGKNCQFCNFTKFSVDFT